MGIELFFDTETSGIANFKKSFICKQPWVCQLGMILSSQEKEYLKADFLIRSNGRIIEDQAKKVHGITESECNRYGISEKSACFLFLEALLACDTIVCHNVQFDKLLICHMLHNNGFKAEANYLNNFKYYCTMERGTELCKIPNPNPRFTNYKWPSLQELYNFLFGSDFEGAHDAMADIKATKTCYYKMTGVM